MREHNGRKQANRSPRAAAAFQPTGSPTGLVDCRVCGAPNRAHRDGCFDCGSSLRLRGEVPLSQRQRLTFRDADVPGHIVSVPAHVRALP
jgi:hypothetical protein